MQIRDLPYSDPGDPDVRSGPRFLLWLGRGQLTGQLKSLSWGLMHHCALAGLPLGVGLAVQAVVEGSGRGLVFAGLLIVALGVLVSVGDTMLHRTAVTNWITAAARVQQLLSRKTAELGSALTRRVAAGEVVAVSTGDVEKIGWFIEALSRFAAAALALVLICVWLVLYLPSLGLLVALAAPALALAVLPLLPGPPGGRTSSARRRVTPPSWPPTPWRACACCAESAARSCSSAAIGALPRRSARQPCAAPGCGPSSRLSRYSFRACC